MHVVFINQDNITAGMGDQSLRDEISFDETDNSLLTISLCENQDEVSPVTNPTSRSHFCSSTPVRNSYKYHHSNTASDYDLGNHVDLCPSHEKCEDTTDLTQDDEFLIIDASMSSLSLTENDETRVSFQNNSLYLDEVSSQASFKGTVSASSNVFSKDNFYMSIAKTELPASLNNVISRDAQKFSGTENKTEVKAEEKVVELVLANKVQDKFINKKLTSSKVLNNLSQLMVYHPTAKKEAQTHKENKCVRRKKFLQNKQKKKLAAARAKENEEKENRQEYVPNERKLRSVTELSSHTGECQNKDGKPVRHALQIIQNWIGEAPPEKKDGDRKIQEFVSDDQNENLDINDPEWDDIKCLKTDEERYKAVKKCWKSNKVPTPQRDLTFHSYRQKRLKSRGNKPVYCNKRKTSDDRDFGLVSKSRKIEEAPCTLFLDRKITGTKEQFTNQQNDNLMSFNQATENIDADYAQRRRQLMTEYYKEVNRVKRMGVNAYSQNWFLRSLDNWLAQQQRWLDKDILKEKEKLKKQTDKVLSNLQINHNFTLKKLEEARNEVLKFNQFYCGLNRIDPTILRGQFLEEIVALEDMYLSYENNYGLAH